MECVKINRINRLIFVDIKLWSVKEGKYRAMSVVVDTGASITTISDYILKYFNFKIDLDKNFIEFERRALQCLSTQMITARVSLFLN